MQSPLKTMDEAALYLRFDDGEGRPNTDALRQFLRRQKAEVFKRGRTTLIHIDELNKLLRRRTA